MVCLFHEKPFAGVNGSGKHVNFSLGNADAGQPARSRRHAARERAVPRVLRRRHPRRAQVRRAAARVGRLGDQRPPPRRERGAARDHLDLPRRAARPTCSSRSPRAAPRSSKDEGHAARSASTRCPSLPKDPGDRNRTSPFAFTGNRFEFRALGSRQSIAGPMVAHQHDPRRVARLHRDQARGAPSPTAPTFNAAVQTLLDGDHHRARRGRLQRRRLLRRVARPRPRSAACRTCAPRSTPCPCCVTDEVDRAVRQVRACSTPRELHSRYEIYLEQYVLSIGVEAKPDAGDGDDRHPARRRCATRPSWRRTSPRSRRPASRPTPPRSTR